jgi:hypothetical protein
MDSQKQEVTVYASMSVEAMTEETANDLVRLIQDDLQSIGVHFQLGVIASLDWKPNL